MPSPELPDSSDLDPALRGLEEKLRDLDPASLTPSVERRLGLRLDIAEVQRQQATLFQRRFIGLVTLTCLVMAGLFWLRHELTRVEPEGSIARAGESLEVPAVPTKDSRSGAPAPPSLMPPPIQTGRPNGSFVPVSSQQHLRQASPGGVVLISDRIPARQVTIEYDRAWHWHDPETQTNIRVFEPRSDTLLVPLEVD